jgi:hypothetical protein
MRSARFVLALCVAGSWLTSTAWAAPITITFDPGDPIGGLAADVGVALAGQYAGVGVTFAANAFTGPDSPFGGWATNTDMTVVSITGTDVDDLGTPPLASGNVLRSFNQYSLENGDPSFRADFATPIASLSAVFLGIDFAPSTGLFAYNGSTLVASATASGTGQQLLTVSSGTPITSVVFTPGDSADWVAVDNIAFTLLDVPEPATVTLLALGLATVVRSRRRR